MGTSKHAKVGACPSCNHGTSCKTLSELGPAGPEEASHHHEKACGKAPGQGTAVASPAESSQKENGTSVPQLQGDKFCLRVGPGQASDENSAHLTAAWGPEQDPAQLCLGRRPTETMR